MIGRRIFKKRKSKIRKISFVFLLILFLLLILYFNLFKNTNYIIIPEKNEKFYIVPEDKGGEKVANLDKKILNSKSKNIVQNKINKSEDLLYSIQIFSNSDIEKVSDYLSQITNLEDILYNIEDFYILALNTEIGIEYFLLYKNFKDRKIADDYCANFLKKIDKCLVVDTTKF